MRRCLAGFAVLLVLVPAAGALFIRPDLEMIPVERLVKNLTDLAEKEPKNAKWRFNLARVHGMAYAKNTDTVTIWKGKLDSGAWFGHTPALVPFAKDVVKRAKTSDKARKHLDQAIAEYKAALEIDPKLLVAQLGLAWCLDQSSARKEAIAGYRQVIEAGWEKDKERKSGPLGGHFITAEAAGYLIPLLDPTADKEEIDTLQDRIAKLRKLPRPVTPIAIPLADGLRVADLLDPKARVAFDADGSGLKKRWTWLTPRAGWLVYDPTRQGKVTSALQLFGNVSFWTFWDDGYQALALLDDNHDGELTGRELDNLAIWHDANGDGICDPGEVRPLSYYGVVAISCRGAPHAHPDCPVYAPRGVRFADGKTRPTFDLILRPR
ncbi:MAG: tetratricopeptide repeat protein [Gemmataceae bacterium]